MTIPDYLKAAADCFPDKTALSDGSSALTFLQLYELSLSTADLIGRRVSVGSRIGIFAHRSTSVVVSMFGTAVSGCCYVPLNPSFPDEKLKKILVDANISLIIGTGEESYTGTDLGCSFLSFSDIRSQNSSDAHGPFPELSDEAPLCIMYTSGSTGAPKGILKSHGSFSNFIETYADCFGFSDREVIGNQTPFCFDASAKDIYLMLKTGARLEIIPTQLFSFPVRLIEYLNEKEITMISWVPSALSLVSRMRTFRDIMPTTLQRVFFVGEVMPRKELESWRSALPDLQYVNLYGSSELAGICCYYEFDKNSPVPDVIPIGHPLGNSEVFLQAEDGSIIHEPGREGELLVSSAALADGYLNDPLKTANVFSVLDTEDGSYRVLHTGDLAVLDEKGCLVYCSRRDHQIKHMGFRIELGEIEAAVNDLEYIAEACCVYDAAKDRIVLFCTTSCSGLTLKAVNNDLRDRLADYMLPNRLIVLDEMPHNTNGKLDRVGLKARV